MEGQWSGGELALMSVLMGSVPLASLLQVYIVLLMSWLLMNLDHQIMLLLESVSSVLGGGGGVHSGTHGTHCPFHHSYGLLKSNAWLTAISTTYIPANHPLLLNS